MTLLILNGPNLNLLGTREPEVYGHASLGDVAEALKEAFPKVSFSFFQSNSEGELVDQLHAAQADDIDGVVLNPGAYGHTSIALRDAIAGIAVPVVEVHISNVYAREAFRQKLMLSGVCAGVISGLGTAGYPLAVRYFVER